MRKIREITSNAGSSYVVETCGATRRVRVSCRCVNVNRADVYVFYDDDMRILYEPSFLLAEEMRWESDNTKLQAVSAMKLLYSFAGAIGMPPEEFDGPTCNAFLQFCRGTLGDGLSASFDLETTRSEATIGAYLKSARRLMKYLGRNDSPFLDRRLVRGPAPQKAIRPRMPSPCMSSPPPTWRRRRPSRYRNTGRCSTSSGSATAIRQGRW